MLNTFNLDGDKKNVCFKKKILKYFVTNGNSTIQELAKEINLSNNQMLETRFKLGYAFKQKQFYFDFPFTFYIDRKHDAYIRTEWASGRASG